MSWGYKNIEDFLSKKLSQLNHEPANDWDVFEVKLCKAVFYRDLRQFTIAGLTAIMLSFWVINNYNIPVAKFKITETKSSKNNSSQTLKKAENFIRPVEQVKLASMPALLIENTSNNPKREEQPSSTVAFLQKGSIVDYNRSKANTIEASSATTQVKQIASSNSRSSYNAKAEEVSNPNIALGESIAEEQPEEILKTELSAPLVELNAQLILDEGAGAFEIKESLGNVLALKNGLKPITVSDLILIRPNVVPKKEDFAPYVSPLQPKGRWSYSLNVYPNFSFRKFEVDQNKLKLLHRDFIDAMEVSEQKGFALNIGIEASLRIGDITYLNSGVEYISTKTQTNFDFNKFRDAITNARTGEIQEYRLRNSPERVTLNQYNQYHYLNVPLSISYQPWATDHMRVNIEGGGSLMYFVGAEGKTLNYQTLDIVELADQEYKDYVGSFFVKIGMQYYVTSAINIGFEPTLMYFTNTIYSDDYPFYVIPYSAGVNLNLQVKLN